ncbi:MAG: rod shape-determining protein MreC [Rhodospirillales bacterium]|nr:rod shape-determining protein MreC [Rhodospirillales bacterium]MCB9965295.1 rod shape-determining protein MreC [Rhodospirillales bacterium]MCB9980126.1 rod shape-determining protein MreC [Rhodospirillales bacterium]
MIKRTQIKSVARTALVGDMSFIPGAVFFLCVSSVLVILSAVNPSLLSSARVAAQDTLAPVLMAVRSPFDAVADMIGDATGLAALRAENERLVDENTRLREWYQQALALQVENKALQSLLRIKLAPELEFKTARLLSDMSSAYAKSAIISAGSDDGLKEGFPVLSGEGVLGRIVELGHHSARVLMLTDLNARIPVVMEGSNTHAIVAGTNDTQPILTHMPADTRFQIGDRLLTSGLGGVYPAGLPVGVVSSVKGTEVRVTPYTDVAHIQFVRVITNVENPHLESRP